MSKPKNKAKKPAKVATRQATMTPITSARRRQRVKHMGPTGKVTLVWREVA